MYAAWKSTESRRPVTSVCYTIHAGTLLTFCDLHPQSMPKAGYIRLLQVML